MGTRYFLGSVLAASVLVVACGGDSDETATTTSTPTTTTEATTTTTEAPLVSPLTGEEVDQSVLDRPVVAVKIDNTHGFSTPQTGLNQADVVYELMVEGTVTRFLALFQSEDTGPVGPVRSARTSEIGILEELHRPLFVWHGANGVLRGRIRGSDLQPRSIDDISRLFYRDRGRRAPYNSYVESTDAVRATAEDGSTGPPESILDFVLEPGDPPSTEATPVSSVHLGFPPYRSDRGVVFVRFDWDPDTGSWLRSQGGAPHVDTDGQQISVTNLIVRFVRAEDSGSRTQTGGVVPASVVTGEGEAWVFSQGTVTAAQWSKPDTHSRTVYRDAAGEVIRLQPGSTWISMPYSVGPSFFE